MMPQLRAALGHVPSEARPLLGAALALAAAAEVFAYAGPGGASREQAAAIMALADQVRSDDAQVARRVRDQRAPASSSAGSPAMSDPLPRIDAAVGRSGIHVVRLAPRPGLPGQYDVEIDATFADLTRFAAAVEGPGSGLRALQIRQAEEMPGRLIASFVLAVSATGSIASQAAEWAGPGRDPFARVSAVIAPHHRLTGVTRVGEQWTATIDGKDYVTGDALGAFSIGEVREETVVLHGPTGESVLSFSNTR